MNADFATLGLSGGSVYAATGDTISIAAGRLSFVLGFQSPCVTVDTACSSGIAALHAAAAAVRSLEAPSALALAVNVTISPRMFQAFGGAGMLSADGRCKTFDQRANGYVRGEGPPASSRANDL